MTKVNSPNISLQQLELNKVDKLFYNTKGVKKADEGKFKEASECFTKAINLAPNDSMSYFNRATVKMNIGDLQGARSDFKLAESFRISSIR